MISVTGGVGNMETFALDGTNHNDAYNGLNLPLPFPDALQEFKVETSALPAQYGLHSSATINAITKSGSNEYHGDAFEFLRNGDLKARDFFAATISGRFSTFPSWLRRQSTRTARCAWLRAIGSSRPS
jgi:hypothetical protein